MGSICLHANHLVAYIYTSILLGHTNLKSCCLDSFYNKMGQLVGKKSEKAPSYNFRYVHAYDVTSHIILLLLLLLGPRHIQPSTYTNVATYPLGKYKQCHRKHSEQCACTCGNDTYAYVHRQGSLTGIRKPQY